MAGQNQDDILNLEDLVEEVEGGAESATGDFPAGGGPSTQGVERTASSVSSEAPLDSSPSAPPSGLQQRLSILKQRLDPLIQKLHLSNSHPILQRVLSAGGTLTTSVARVARLIPTQKLTQIAKIPTQTLRLLKRFLEKLLAYILWFFKAPWMVRIQILLMVTLTAALVFVTKLILQGEFLKEPEPFAIASLEEKADAVFQIGPEEYYESFISPLRQPDFHILLKKVVVQLKAYPNQRHPMAAMQLYAEASNQEAAVELKDREDEFLDLIQRTVETYPVEELSTRKGMVDLKDHLRARMNQNLSRGRVHALYFHEFLLKR